MAKIAQKGSGSALDLAMAAFAGTAAGFVIYAMPSAQFDRMVELSGLPLVLSAAQPPLGMTARLAVMAAAAIGTWLLVWLVLRALGKKPAQPKRRQKPEEIDVPLPRLRRADAHPDAPARAPIFAGLELGTPLDDVKDDEETRADDEGEGDEEEAIENDAAPQADETFELVDPASEDADPVEVVDAEPVQLSEPESASISHLMQRLELGLLRRERSGWEEPVPVAPQQQRPSPELDQRLRSAIDDLQRLASRSG